MMKVAIVHDYLKEYGGAERVVEALHELYPDAPVFTAYYDPSSLGPHKSRIEKWDIRTSWLQKVPFAERLISPFRIFAPLIFESFDLAEYDVVISSSAIYFAKAVITKPQTLHLAYIHTPPRYLYGFTTSYNYRKHWWTKVLGELANHFLRLWDFETSQRPDVLIANSENVAQRITKFYRREPVVVYPPVEVDKIKDQRSKIKNDSKSHPELVSGSRYKMPKQVRHDNKKGDYYLSLSRLVRGKGVEVIVQACSELNLPLKVAGEGPEVEDLKNIAGSTVEFLGQVSDEERIRLYYEAKALILASEDEDFGITSVEAQAAGIPVIAPKTGGYLETVIEGKTGMFYPKVTVENLKKALQLFNPEKYKPSDCQKNAEKFSKERFKEEIMKLVNEHLNSNF